METESTLSKKALDLLENLFNETSNLNLPAGLAEQILEIRAFVRMGLHSYGGEKEGGARNELATVQD